MIDLSISGGTEDSQDYLLKLPTPILKVSKESSAVTL